MGIELKPIAVKLLKSYLGYPAGTVAEAHFKDNDRVNLLIKGSASVIGKTIFDANMGIIFEQVQDKPTPPNPEPQIDPEDLKPVNPVEAEKDAQETGPQEPQ